MCGQVLVILVHMYSKGSSSAFCYTLNAVDQYITLFDDDYVGTLSAFFTKFGSGYDQIGDCAGNTMN